MKRLLLVLLCFLFIAGMAISESPATPTDLDEIYEIFEDDDFGYIDPNLIQRRVFLNFPQESVTYGDEVTLVAILVDFQPNDTYTFEWEYSEDDENWNLIDDAHDQTYTFILDPLNYAYYWRVKVILQEEIL